MPIRVRRAAGDADIAHFRRMAEEFVCWLRDSLGVDLEYQGFQREMERLPEPYGEPRGFILIAEDTATDGAGAEVAGVVALKPLFDAVDTGSARVCEMKRMYVRPAFRGRGVGRMLVHACVEGARAGGLYDLMVLDTIERLAGANRLYSSSGFTSRGPYYALTDDIPAGYVSSPTPIMRGLPAHGRWHAPGSRRRGDSRSLPHRFSPQRPLVRDAARGSFGCRRVSGARPRAAPAPD